MLQSCCAGWQRVGHDLVTEEQQSCDDTTCKTLSRLWPNSALTVEVFKSSVRVDLFRVC